jgi:2-dehydropantoate 2-reductase
MKWSKLLTTMVSNATSAITGLDPGQVYAHPALARLEIEALREAVRVMSALGFNPQNLPGVSVALLGRAVFLPTLITRQLLGRIVARGRGQKKPSLHFDIGRGRSEIDWLNGAVVRYGAQVGVPTPVNLALTHAMKALVEDASLHTSFLGKPEALLAMTCPDTDGDR